MAWVYKIASATYFERNSKLTILYSGLKNLLNGLTDIQTQSAKFSSIIIDQFISQPGEYEIIVIYTNDLDKAPDISELTNDWQCQRFTNTLNDYFSQIYPWQALVEFLNNPQSGLSPAQKFWSFISIDQTTDITNNVAFWYRKRKNQ